MHYYTLQFNQIVKINNKYIKSKINEIIQLNSFSSHI